MLGHRGPVRCERPHRGERAHIAPAPRSHMLGHRFLLGPSSGLPALRPDEEGLYGRNQEPRNDSHPP